MLLYWKSIFWSLIGLGCLILEAHLLIKYLNKTNSRLALFVNSIRNEDTSISFPADIENGPVEALYKGLRHVNEVIRQAKVQSEHKENMLRTLIEHSSTALFTIDAKGNFRLMNNQARHILDVEHATNMMRIKQTNPELHQVLSQLKNGETQTYQVKKPEGTRKISVSQSAIKCDDQELVIVSMQDISQELDATQQDSWHKLFRVITHEIMNSIAPITSLSKTLIEYFEDSDGQPKAPQQVDAQIIENSLQGLKIIDTMSNGLKSFVHNYRQFDKLPDPKLEEIEIKPWLTKLKVLMLEMTEAHGIQLSIRVKEACKTIHGDQKMLSQVLLNLVQNAIEAFENKNEKQIEISVYPSAGGQTIFQVADNGSGIPAEILDKIFVPFYTTKEQGNGIGLSLSKQIMHKHGGSLTLASEVGVGTKVFVGV